MERGGVVHAELDLAVDDDRERLCVVRVDRVRAVAEITGACEVVASKGEIPLSEECPRIVGRESLGPSEHLFRSVVFGYVPADSNVLHVGGAQGLQALHVVGLGPHRRLEPAHPLLR